MTTDAGCFEFALASEASKSFSGSTHGKEGISATSTESNPDDLSLSVLAGLGELLSRSGTVISDGTVDSFGIDQCSLGINASLSRKQASPAEKVRVSKNV
jgi:hypothetical protein